MALRVGIIGFGRIGALHAHWLSSIPEACVAGVVDPTPSRRAMAAAQGLATYEDEAVLLEDRLTDAVLVSTPSSMHFDQARACLRSGKHLMVEKPMTLNLPEAQQLVQEARVRSRLLSVFHNRRWDPDYLALHQAIREGTFGRVFNVESRLWQWASCVGPAAPEWRPSWRNEAVYGGGALFDWATHFLDQIWRLLWPARPQRVFAQLRGNVWTSDCDDLARIVLDFDSGTLALVEINTTTTRPLPRWHVDGTAGSADSPFDLSFDPNVWAQLRFTPVGSNEGRMLPRAEAGLSPPQIWQRFAAACLGEGPPAVPAESVLPTIALLDAARRSSATGASVDVIERVDWIL